MHRATLVILLLRLRGAGRLSGDTLMDNKRLSRYFRFVALIPLERLAGNSHLNKFMTLRFTLPLALLECRPPTLPPR